MTKPKIKAIFSFLNNYEPFDDEEIFLNFTNAVNTMTGKTNTMTVIEQVAEIRAAEALEKGLKMGKEDQSRKVIKNLLTDSSFSMTKIAKLVGVSLSFVKKVRSEA